MSIRPASLISAFCTDACFTHSNTKVKIMQVMQQIHRPSLCATHPCRFRVNLAPVAFRRAHTRFTHPRRRRWCAAYQGRLTSHGQRIHHLAKNRYSIFQTPGQCYQPRCRHAQLLLMLGHRLRHQLLPMPQGSAHHHRYLPTFMIQFHACKTTYCLRSLPNLFHHLFCPTHKLCRRAPFRRHRQTCGLCCLLLRAMNVRHPALLLCQAQCQALTRRAPLVRPPACQPRRPCQRYMAQLVGAHCHPIL